MCSHYNDVMADITELGRILKEQYEKEVEYDF